MDHGEVVHDAVAVAIVILPGEDGIVGVDGIHDLPHEVRSEHVVVAACTVGSIELSAPYQASECAPPATWDRLALRHELAPGLLQVIVGHSAATQVDVAQIRMVDDHAASGPTPKYRSLYSEGGVIVPKGVVVARAWRRDFVMQRPCSGHRIPHPSKVSWWGTPPAPPGS